MRRKSQKNAQNRKGMIAKDDSPIRLKGKFKWIEQMPDNFQHYHDFQFQTQSIVSMLERDGTDCVESYVNLLYRLNHVLPFPDVT